MHPESYRTHRRKSRRITGLDKKSPWLPFKSPVQAARLRLFCLPHAGGGAREFYSWGTALPPLVDLCPVLLPGRETRFTEYRFTDIAPLTDAIVAAWTPWLDIPYAIFGHSMGALLAFECARRLRNAGHPAPQWLFLSGRRAPDGHPDPHPLHALPDTRFLEQLHRIYQGIPQELLENPEIMAVFLPTLRADISVVESFRFEEQEPLDCPITVFAGQDDASVSWQQLFAWRRQTRRAFAAHIFPGGHFYPREPLLRSISATLLKLAV